MWGDRFDGLEKASAACPGLAFGAAAVELGNVAAEAAVWYGGAMVGSYG